MSKLSEGQTIKFVEVMNDTWDYLFLADPHALRRFQADNQLPEDLITEFTSTEQGDHAVEQGAMIPLSGIDNFPYVVHFTAGRHAELLAAESDLQHHQKGYRLRVESGQIFLFSIPYLQRFNAAMVEKLEVAGHKGLRPAVSLSPGWYEVEVLAGQTRQGGELEPTLEFLLTQCDNEPPFSANINYWYRVKVNVY